MAPDSLPRQDERTLWLVIPVARELLPELLEGVPASRIRLEKLDVSSRAYDLIVTAPESPDAS